MKNTDKLWYGFAKGKTDGDRTMKNLLGGKGSNLAEMCNLDVPVPPGFTLPTNLCLQYFEDGNKLSDAVLTAIDEGVAYTESALEGPKFGTGDKPLLFSVRSGARVSMPGMMDTVLNLGLNDDTVEALAKWAGNRRFALDSYRRLIQMFGDVVKGVSRESLDKPLEAKKEEKGVEFDNQLTDTDLEAVIKDLKAVYRKSTGEDFPQNPIEQLRSAVEAVFSSWNVKRAIDYRNINKIGHNWGTAANVQAMVFGNFGDTSGTGVAFTRNPSTGENKVMGEWLPNAQGEDVVAGIRTPGPIWEADAAESAVGSLEKGMPVMFKELMQVMGDLEKHYKDMQDIEFTIQEGKLYLLQTRSGKRTAPSALKLALDMVEEGLIDERTAVTRVEPEQIDQLMHPQIDPNAERTLITKGLPASPGAASGQIVLDSDEAEKWNNEGKKVILVRKETSPEDIHGMHAAQGILTATGGMTSHAAVVARGMGRTCIAGCASLDINEDAGTVAIKMASGDIKTYKIGDEITLDGTVGEVLDGIVPTVKADLSGDFGKFMAWADKARKLGVRTNSDTPEDSALAVELGAEGIGLCRTEHMFFAPERILAMREMIIATDLEAREKALVKLEPMQRADFVGIFTAMNDKPVTIRLLDPPLHEFLPHTDEGVADLAKVLGVKPEVIAKKAELLHEFNPMLGHRGTRLGITYPEVYAMQARAILLAACDAAKAGIKVYPEIMIPLVMIPEELKRTRAQIMKISEEIFEKEGIKVDFMVGTMIELPRAALTADEIADHADFFSFGTNDLTQTTMGLSRDDSGRFLPTYVQGGIMPADPFASIDVTGVGKLVEMGTKLGRSKKEKLKVGVCGEHGGDPDSIHFFSKVGLDYVSCSPYRVPVARLAAAQAAIMAEDAQ